MSLQFDQDRIKKRIKESLGKIYAEADPSALDQYRRLIKQEVSFFKRSYFAAYLLMELEQRGGGKRYGANGHPGRGNQSGSPRKYGNEAERAEDRQKAEKGDYPLPEEESVRLFFSVGRSRKVFPREILGLIISKTLIAKEDIGAIRILDNYSFVQVRDTVADSIISALNGNVFRGRPLLVNYARIKKDAETGPGGEDRQDDAPEAPVREKPDFESESDGGVSAGDPREYDPGDSGADPDPGALPGDPLNEDDYSDTEGV
ncbi:MAG: DbpA RNA binding domain-containing protein [Spirochaetaceae bacterium]|jgi:hypothetical protein|nr:DbpA RNA binding domain-containing protein [Spirochaetaceae bacterium]